MAFCAGATLRCNTKDTARLLADDKFCALETVVDMVPRFNTEEPVDCIRGFVGPFQSNVQCQAPLWVALELDRLQQATIMLPDWMQEEELKRIREDEKASDRFTPVHEHYIEVACALLAKSRAFANDHQAKKRTVSLIREIIEIRRAKIVEGLKELELTRPEVKNLTNISAAELTCFRTRTFQVMDKFAELTQLGKSMGHSQEDTKPSEVTSERAGQGQSESRSEVQAA